VEIEKENISPLHQEGLENRFLRLATSTYQNNRVVWDAIENILNA